MQILQLKASLNDESLEQAQDQDRSSTTEPKDTSLSTYKGRENEVDLNHCFEELERVLQTYISSQEDLVSHLQLDKEQLTGTIGEKTQDLADKTTELEQVKDKASKLDQITIQLQDALENNERYKEELERR